MHVASSPLQVPSSVHVLESLPVMMKPGSQDTAQVSLWFGPPSSPNSQSIVPFSGASRGQHIAVEMANVNEHS